MEKKIQYEIIQNNNNKNIIYIKFKRCGIISPEGCEALMILVNSAKLMLSGVLRTQISYHSFYIDVKELTLIFFDYTDYKMSNATKIAKHLQNVYSVLLSKFGCSSGLKY